MADLQSVPCPQADTHGNPFRYCEICGWAEKPARKPRPKKDTRTSTAIRLPDDLHDRLQAAAAERDLSINWLVNRAVAYYLDRLIPVEELTLVREPRSNP